MHWVVPVRACRRCAIRARHLHGVGARQGRACRRQEQRRIRDAQGRKWSTESSGSRRGIDRASRYRSTGTTCFTRIASHRIALALATSLSAACGRGKAIGAHSCGILAETSWCAYEAALWVPVMEMILLVVPAPPMRHVASRTASNLHHSSLPPTDQQRSKSRLEMAENMTGK